MLGVGRGLVLGVLGPRRTRTRGGRRSVEIGGRHTSEREATGGLG